MAHGIWGAAQPSFYTYAHNCKGEYRHTIGIIATAISRVLYDLLFMYDILEKEGS